jgi:hypothetical protein
LKVTILIVNYNNWEDTVECIESVCKSTYKDFEVIVVDNSPNDISVNKLQEWAKGAIKINKTLFPELVYPEEIKPLDYILISEEVYYNSNVEVQNGITFIKAQNNHGFAAANNIVLKKLIKTKKNDDFVFLLNNDTVLQRDTITNLVNNYTNANMGVVGCVLMEYNAPKKVQSVGGLYNKVFGTTTQVLEGIEIEELINQDIKAKIDYPCGAAMFLSNNVLKDIGLLNEKYFLFYEELDWIKTANEKHKTTYFEDCIVYHKRGVSIGSNKKSYIGDKYSIINRVNFAKKHNRKNLLTVYLGVLISVFKRILFFKFNRAFSLIKDILSNEN